MNTDEKLSMLLNSALSFQVEKIKIEKKLEVVREEIKSVMRKESTELFQDEHNNSLSFKMYTREKLNKKRVKELLSKTQFMEVVSTKTYEVLRIMSAASREKSKRKRGELNEKDKI